MNLTRRIIAILGTAVFFGVMSYQAIANGNEIAQGALGTAGAMIIAYYFGAKSNGG